MIEYILFAEYEKCLFAEYENEKCPTNFNFNLYNDLNQKLIINIVIISK